MEGAPVTAATGALGPVVAKLGALLGSQYKLRCRTRKDVRLIKSKLKSVHSILWAIWGKETLDAQSKELKKEALDLADDIHDAIDDFILTLEPSHRNKHLKIQIKIEASPFEGFRTRVDEVSGRCGRKWKWEKSKCAEPISSLFSRKNATSSAPSKPPPPRAPFIHKDASELVGMHTWRNYLITYLVGGGEEEDGTMVQPQWCRYLVGEQQEESTMVQPQLKMASIVGMAGVGKTTLARHVYEEKEIESKFQCRAFVSVTPTPDIKEVLTSLLQQLGAELPAGTKAITEEDIIHTISSFLENKRYLVIIDDIWHRGEWDIISKSFPQNNLGSRIVMTTRIHSVPGDDFDTQKLHITMNNLLGRYAMSDGRTWLFVSEDLAARMKPETVGEGFDCDHPIVRMCGGVPLALLCLFSAMAILQEQQEQLGVHVKACDVQDMIEKQVKQSGIQNTPGFEPLVESLELGYDDLPHHMLKTCLLYCSIYPENHHFHMNDLVMRWVAEGFAYKEDVAKDYLEELRNRGLLMLRQPPWKNDPEYQMNPMMRNFLRWKSHEDNFITCSSDITLPYACRIHRLCIDDYLVDDGAMEVVDTLLELDWSQIRSLVVFEGAKRYVPFEKLERVRVLDLQYHHIDFEDPRWISFGDFGFEALGNQHVKDICGLLRVRHLFGLEGTGISEIPREIARLQHLETLQVSFTWITELPCEIGGLQQLKTLVLRGNTQLAKLPREIWNLQNLENLNLYGVMLDELPREIGKLQHLKALEVGWACITRLPSEIGDLQNLESLDLSLNRRLTQLPREIGKLQNLKRLMLSYTGVTKLPREIGGLKKLETLKLDQTMGALPWEASQLSKLEGLPECVRQARKNSDLVSSVLAGEMLSIRLPSAFGSGGLIVGSKHMHIPWWIRDHFNELYSLDIRTCKLEEEPDLKILREMPKLYDLKLRLEVVPRDPIAISGEGFQSLQFLSVYCRIPLVISFQEGAMPKLFKLYFEFQFYGGPPPAATANKGPLGLGIKHLRRLYVVEFRCNQKWYGGATESIRMIDVVRKEAREHPNEISFWVTGSKLELFPAKEVSSSSSSSSYGRDRGGGGGDPGSSSVIGFLPTRKEEEEEVIN